MIKQKDIIKRTCVYCNKQFETRSPKAMYCSDVCRGRFAQKLKQTFITKTCPNCGKEFETTRGNKICCSKECGKEYQLKKNRQDGSTAICPNCGKDYISKGRKKFCCEECSVIYKSKTLLEGTDALTCQICGFKTHRLDIHIRTKHDNKIDEYCELFKVTKYNLISPSAHENISKGQKRLFEEGRGHGFTSESNPSNSKDCKNGRNSPYSMNFRGYDGMSDDEKMEEINKLKIKSLQNKENNNNNPLTLEYYIKRGMTKEEAETVLKERQTTFTLEKCIDRYGEEEGRKKYSERQERWQKNFKKTNYSMISQDLFWKIYNQIGDYFGDVYFATKHPKTNKNENDNHNYEYVLKLNETSIRPDFYIPKLKKVIEFDGDYWHGEKRGNQERDRLRDNMLIETGNSIIHIKERDYKKDPEKVIQECLNYLNN